MRLVYGGGTAGLMGEVARTLVSLSGPDAVHGVIPEALMAYERAGRDGKNGIVAAGGDAGALVDGGAYGKCTIVKDMHSRKRLMAQEVIDGGPGSGFVALSGGYGTLEELAEVIAWHQLGIHARGVVVFNVDGLYDGLLQFVRTAVEAGFIKTATAGIMVEAKTAEEVLDALAKYQVSDGRFKLNWSQT